MGWFQWLRKKFNTEVGEASQVTPEPDSPAEKPTVSPSSSEAREPDEEQVKCADCRQTFVWENAYNQQDTPGSESFHPPGHGIFHPRAFCPHCGALVAEWDIDRQQDYDRWKWYGENAALNSARPLPPYPLLFWGKAMPNLSLASIDCKKIQIPAEASGSPEKLFWAVVGGNAAEVKIQLEAGVDPNIRNYVGETPLMLAAEKGHEEVARALLAGGAKVNDQEVYGRHTPLILATMEGHAALIRTLLEAGADPNLQNQFGKTALMLAKDKGHQDIEAMLHNAGVTG